MNPWLNCVPDARELLRDCRLCPRDCGVDRTVTATGAFCRLDQFMRTILIFAMWSRQCWTRATSQLADSFSSGPRKMLSLSSKTNSGGVSNVSLRRTVSLYALWRLPRKKSAWPIALSGAGSSSRSTICVAQQRLCQMSLSKTGACPTLPSLLPWS